MVRVAVTRKGPKALQ